MVHDVKFFELRTLESGNFYFDRIPSWERKESPQLGLNGRSGQKLGYNTYIYIVILKQIEYRKFSKRNFSKKINSWNIFKTLSFYTFFVFVKSFLASFGHGSGEILKNTKIKQHQKIDRILFQTRQIEYFEGIVNTTSDIQDCCYPKGITYLIIIHEGDPIPCKTTYIEYRSPVKTFIIFFRMPPNSIGLHCKIVFFSQFYDAGRGGYPSVSLKNSFFKTI